MDDGIGIDGEWAAAMRQLEPGTGWIGPVDGEHWLRVTRSSRSPGWVLALGRAQGLATAAEELLIRRAALLRLGAGDRGGTSGYAGGLDEEGRETVLVALSEAPEGPALVQAIGQLKEALAAAESSPQAPSSLSTQCGWPAWQAVPQMGRATLPLQGFHSLLAQLGASLRGTSDRSVDFLFDEGLPATLRLRPDDRSLGLDLWCIDLDPLEPAARGCAVEGILLCNGFTLADRGCLAALDEWDRVLLRSHRSVECLEGPQLQDWIAEVLEAARSVRSLVEAFGSIRSLAGDIHV